MARCLVAHKLNKIEPSFLIKLHARIWDIKRMEYLTASLNISLDNNNLGIMGTPAHLIPPPSYLKWNLQEGASSAVWSWRPWGWFTYFFPYFFPSLLPYCLSFLFSPLLLLCHFFIFTICTGTVFCEAKYFMITNSCTCMDAGDIILCIIRVRLTASSGYWLQMCFFVE